MVLCRTCFGTLVVVEDAVLRYIMTKIDLMKDPGYYNYRVHWLKLFQEHVHHSEHVHLRVRCAVTRHLSVYSTCMLVPDFVFVSLFIRRVYTQSSWQVRRAGGGLR